MYLFTPELAKARIDDLTRSARYAHHIAAARTRPRTSVPRRLAVRLWRRPAPAAA